MMFDTHEFNEQADRLDPDNVVGRYVENDFGHQQLITMRRFFWDYLDWLEDSGPRDKRAYIKACDRSRTRTALEERLEAVLRVEMRTRRKLNRPEPAWLKNVQLPPT
jgi:hypothetical protein